MNYWHAETTNLTECALPLVDLIAGLSQERRRHRPHQLRCQRLGLPPQHRPLASVRPRRHGTPRLRPHLGQLRHVRPLALLPHLGAFPLHRRQAVPRQHLLPSSKAAPPSASTGSSPSMATPTAPANSPPAPPSPPKTPSSHPTASPPRSPPAAPTISPSSNRSSPPSPKPPAS
jgi:hypothetical protein